MEARFIYKGHTQYMQPFINQALSEKDIELWKELYKEAAESSEMIFFRRYAHPAMYNFLSLLSHDADLSDMNSKASISLYRVYTHSIDFLLFFYHKYEKDSRKIKEVLEERFLKEILSTEGFFFRMLDDKGLETASCILRCKIKEIYFLLQEKGEPESQTIEVENAFLDLANYAIMTIVWINKHQSK